MVKLREYRIRQQLSFDSGKFCMPVIVAKFWDGSYEKFLDGSDSGSDDEEECEHQIDAQEDAEAWLYIWLNKFDKT